MGGVHLIMRFSCKNPVPVYSVHPRKCKSDGNFFIVILPTTKNEAFA